MCCKIACYERFCEGCESKKCKTAGCACIRARERASIWYSNDLFPSLDARAYARVREPSHRAKRKEKSWMREKGKSARAVGDKNVRAISKSVGEKKKSVGEKKKNVGENLENLRRFLRNLRSLVVMLAGCV